MKYSYNWLKELSGTKKSPKELAELLTMRAFEFEDMKTEGKETQMEFSILPNRGHDALSHTGMAREISACEGRKFSSPPFLKPSFRNGLGVEIQDKKLCPRYIGAVLENISVGQSPKWMQTRLLASGVKPINNIVDITNYVMLETGQPMHAFDIAKIATRNAKPEIIVRKGKKGEKIKLLDEKEYELTEKNLVIADSEKPIALAGVMGGFDSAISRKTTSILLESANFNSTSIRKTRTSHNIITESSHRFEREIDPNLAEAGMARAIEFVKELCGKGAEITAYTDIYPKKVKAWQIRLETSYVNSLLGENIPVPKMKNILENLGLAVKMSGKIFNCEIPTRRIDLKTQEDLIEEIGRIYGYENIKEQAPVVEVKTPPQNLKRDFENKLRDILVGLGFSEVMNYSFYSADDIAKCNLKIEDHIEVANPLSLDQQYLRRNLISNLLKNVKLNLKNFPKVQIFEIGKKFRDNKGKFSEYDHLAGVFVDNLVKETPFFELKGKTEALLINLGYQNVKYEALQNPEMKFWHQSRTARIVINNQEIGKVGEINPQILENYGIKKRVAVFGLKISVLLEMKLPEKQYKAVSKLPIVERDLSMFVEKETKYSDIVASIKKSGGNLVKNINLFDVFEKEGEKSLALRLKIGSDAKTLTSAEIDAVMKKIISALEKDLKVKVRK
ncbi:MAG: phenylalanine--tRNA ligase subunit beta [Candidatus Moranbacteria bacterium]|nr:phenylalanine--tRNA ligase subunit beta [Candidatus Moranbacteria bacterium]